MLIWDLEIIFYANNMEVWRKLNLDIQRNFETRPFSPDLKVYLYNLQTFASRVNLGTCTFLFWK